MKDPKTPKSPKRVLFSIEDGVVSPSTSPTLSRKAAAGGNDATESILSFAKRTTREKKKKNRRKERGDGDRGRRGRNEGLGNQEQTIEPAAQSQSWTKPIPMGRGRDAHTNEITTDDTAALDDFETVDQKDGDDMFAFDEDLTDSGVAKPSETKEELDLDDDVNVKALAEAGTSPHAGSLPIEIKWPGRRDSGGPG